MSIDTPLGVALLVVLMFGMVILSLHLLVLLILIVRDEFHR